MFTTKILIISTTYFEGNGTIGLEIIEDCPNVDTIIGPFGGGGHLCGIASAVKAINPDVKVCRL